MEETGRLGGFGADGTSARQVWMSRGKREVDTGLPWAFEEEHWERLVEMDRVEEKGVARDVSVSRRVCEVEEGLTVGATMLSDFLVVGRSFRKKASGTTASSTAKRTLLGLDGLAVGGECVAASGVSSASISKRTVFLAVGLWSVIRTLLRDCQSSLV